MLQDVDPGAGLTKKRSSQKTTLRVAKYLFVRLLTIALTIFVGVFITVALANRNDGIDNGYGLEIFQKLVHQFPFLYCYDCQTSPDQKLLGLSTQQEMFDEAGLNLPFWQRTLLYTTKALRLDLGIDLHFLTPPGTQYSSNETRVILLTDFPHTLLLISTSFLLLFILGIPLSLALYRKQGGVMDRLMALLVPISSIPSWVITILLILIFSVEIHLLPPAGMVDTLPTTTKIQQILMVANHMIIPVLAILLSMFFQCVYAWRTFFLIYADENYLELAKAKGLPQRLIERRYILRPTLPYLLTSFAMLLVSFWQMTTALEYILNWPGIGRLYIYSLPHLAEDIANPIGYMNITVGIVVLFAYLLGITVLILDIFYALVDPRIRIGSDEQNMTSRVSRRRQSIHLFRRRVNHQLEKSNYLDELNDPKLLHKATKERVAFTARLRSFWTSLKPVGAVFREIVHYPTALFGLVIILTLVVGSILAVTLFPYNHLGEIWNTLPPNDMTTIPKYAKPVWINWFRMDKLEPTQILDSSDGSAKKTTHIDSSGMPRITITYTYDQTSSEFPQDLIFYFDTKYAKKQPFAVLTWITPDGRTFQLNGSTMEHSGKYSLATDTSIAKLLVNEKEWQTWFLPASNNYPTPAFDLLFALPHSDKPLALKGTYQLRLDGYTFEPGSDIDAKLVVIGQIWGWGGTDFLRRNLLIPLLWGMPFALLIGLVGASVTTTLSMILAATGVWFGGWVDTLIQRLVEANMILPVIAICVLVYANFNLSLWAILWIVVLLGIFGSPIKSFRAALLQVKNAPYIESARAYNTSNSRIIFHYLIPSILPILLPQFISLIPSYVFLEATLGIFGVTSPYPTWGSVIYSVPV